VVLSEIEVRRAWQGKGIGRTVQMPSYRSNAIPCSQGCPLTILHTDHRRPIDTFPTTISTVIALRFYTIA
jgi:hypothetical protein